MATVHHLDYLTIVEAFFQVLQGNLFSEVLYSNGQVWLLANLDRSLCTLHTSENSLRQLPDHGDDTVGDSFEFGVDFIELAGGLEDVEVAVEGDFVADLGFVVVDPGIGDVGEDFPLEVVVDVFTEGDVFGVAEFGVGFGLAFAFPLLFGDDLAVLVPFGAFDGDGLVAEVGSFENAADGDGLCFTGGQGLAAQFLSGFGIEVDFSGFAEDGGDLVDVFIAEFFALAAQAFAHLLPHAAGVDQLDLVFAVLGLLVGDDPDISADAGIVEHVGRQADDGFQQIILEDIAADFAFPAARIAGKQGRTVKDDAEPAAALFSGTHLGNQVHQEEQRAVADAGQTGAETPVEAVLLMFLFDFLLNLFPFDAEGGIGEHVVKVLAGELIVGEGVAMLDVFDVLPFDQHVGFADRVGFGVELLTVHDEPGIGVLAAQVLFGNGEHASGSGGRVVEGTDDAGFGEGVVVFNKQQIDHQPDDFAGGEVLPGGLVGEFGELADQFFKNEPHLRVGDELRMQVDIGELFGDQVEQPVAMESFNLGVKLEAFEDVADLFRKAVDVREQVFVDMVLVSHQLFEVEGGVIIEIVPCLSTEEGFRVDVGFFALGFFLEDGCFRRFQDAVQPTQDGEREDDFAIFRLFVIAAEQIGDGPDERG